MACKQKGFKFVGCEINKDYVEIIKRRLAQGSVADFTQLIGCPDGSFNRNLQVTPSASPKVCPQCQKKMYKHWKSNVWLCDDCAIGEESKPSS